MADSVQMSTAVSQGRQTLTQAQPDDRFYEVTATSSYPVPVERTHANSMNSPSEAERVSSVETSIPITDYRISVITDLLSLVGRKRDVVSAKANETRFRAYLSSGDNSRLGSSQEPRIEGLLRIKGPSDMRQNRLKISSLLTDLRTQMNDLSANQATIDLFKEDLPEEAMAILDSLHLSNPGENLSSPETPDLSTDFKPIEKNILEILTLRQDLQVETNKRDFYPVLLDSSALPCTKVPDVALMDILEPLSLEDIKKLPVRLDAFLNDKTKPILQSVVE